MSDLPSTFKRQDLMAALELLGIPSADTRQVTIYPDRIVVKRNDRDADGRLSVSGFEVSVSTTVIGLEKE